MALTPSSMMPLGTPAPDFSLSDAISKKPLSLSDVRGSEATLVMFICNHCPFVKHVEEGLIALVNDYKNSDIGFVAISSNDAEQYPDDSPQAMATRAEEKGYPFPYLYDENQNVAKAYDATCTPDFFLFDRDLKCVYRGQLDPSRPGNDIPVSGKDIRRAIDALLSGQPIANEQIPSVGCNIKWK